MGGEAWGFNWPQSPGEAWDTGALLWRLKRSLSLSRSLSLLVNSPERNVGSSRKSALGLGITVSKS